MKAYIITYDLTAPRDYGKINDKIKSYGFWAYLSTTTYIIATNENAVTIRDKLLPTIKANDKLFIARVSKGDWASYGLPNDALNWLHQYA